MISVSVCVAFGHIPLWRGDTDFYVLSTSACRERFADLDVADKIVQFGQTQKGEGVLA